MEDFHLQFSLDSIKNLKNLQRNLQNSAKFSMSERREIFRTLHTIKGTAQTFGFSAASRLAHELENILSAEEFIQSDHFQTLFAEGIEFLIKSFEEENFDFPAQFAKKIHQIIPKNLQSPAVFDLLLPEIPVEIVKYLSQPEKIALDSALKIGKNIYCFEVSFDTASFADKLIECREFLTRIGDIIATLPVAEFDPSGRVGFRILYASSAEKPQIEAIAQNFHAKITLQRFTGRFYKRFARSRCKSHRARSRFSWKTWKKG